MGDAKPTPVDVDAYIAGAGEDARRTLREVRAIVLATVPDAEEGISWGVPFYRHHGPLAGIAAYARHVSFGIDTPLPPDVRAAFEGAGYATGKKTVRIGFDQPVPADLVERVLREKARANEAARAGG